MENDNNMFRKIPPFKWFVLQNFPFIEADFDAITNYQLLCKIVEYLNATIDKTNELGTQVENLTNWFNNLDVQDEIDNKLDEMTQDGTLAEIINEQIFNELSTQVDANTEDIGNLQTSVETLEQTTETNRSPVNFYKGKNLVAFGDSYIQPDIPNSEYGHLINRLATATQMTAFNFGVAGAGFARTNNILYSQLQTALSSMTETQRLNTSIVIVYAGYNDIKNDMDTDAIVTNCVTLVREINIAFPNAKIILAPFNWGYGKLSEQENTKITVCMNRIERDTSLYPVTLLKLARFWNLGILSYFRNESHPSVAGYNHIASFFLNAIYGNSEHVEIGSSLSPLIGHDSTSFWHYKDGIVYFRYMGRFSSNLENYAQIIFNDMHALMCLERDIIVPLSTIEGTVVGTLRLTSGGQGAVKIIELEAETYVFTPTITFIANAWKDFS